MEGEDGKSKGCALVTSTLKGPRDEKEQGKENEGEPPVRRRRGSALSWNLVMGFKETCHMLLMNKIRTKD